MVEQRRFEVGQKWRDVYSPHDVVVIREVLTNGVYYDWPDLAECFRVTSDFLENFEPADTSPTSDPVVGVDDVRFLKELHRQTDPLPFVTEILGEWRDPVVEQPKADPYIQHRLEFPDDVAARNTDSEPRNIAARGRLVAALAAEHTRQADSSGLLHPKEFWSGRRGGRRKMVAMNEQAKGSKL